MYVIICAKDLGIFNIKCITCKKNLHHIITCGSFIKKKKTIFKRRPIITLTTTTIIGLNWLTF